MPSGGDDEAEMSQMPQPSRHQKWLGRWEAQKALSAVWLSVHPPHTPSQAPQDEDQRRPVLAERPI
jgi:hypothetical protein